MTDFENRIMTGSAVTEEENQEISLRPQRLQEYIGQAQATDNLKIFIEAAKLRGEALSFSRP